MFTKFLKKFLILIFILNLYSKLILGNCMSARQSSSSDADCYLNHLARENVMRMGMEGSCDSPRQQIVYPDDNTKMFMPRGTLLFRCNDHSGCCPQKEHSCQPLQEEELRVAFYAMECGAGDSRPQPEYVVMKNHTKCGCRPPKDDMSFDPSPQRLQDMVCGGRGGKQRSGYGQSSGYGGGGGGYGGGGGGYGGGGGGYGGGGYSGQSSAYGQRSGYGSGSQQSSPCSNSMSNRPLTDGQVVRGTIRLTVGPKGFSMADQQQQPCPFG